MRVLEHSLSIAGMHLYFYWSCLSGSTESEDESVAKIADVNDEKSGVPNFSQSKHTISFGR